MNKHSNGSKPPGAKDKIVQFPTLADRDRARREAAAEEKSSAAFQGGVSGAPFINLSKIPPFTRILVATLLVIHLGLSFVDEGTRYQIFYTFGFVPAYFSGAVTDFPKIAYVGIVTHLFLHAGWMHIAFNSIMALTFGILFEREFGARLTILFWFACGLAGAAFYFMLNPAFAFPVIGASGSISGLFAAAILLLNHQQRGMGIQGRGPWPLLLFWLGFMIFTGLLSGDNTAWQAHAGGFLCGAGLYYWLRVRRRARL